MTRQEMMKAGKWDFVNYRPLPGYETELVSEPTKETPAGPAPETPTEADKDIMIRRLEGRCKQISKQLKEANAEIMRLRNMHHLQIAGYVKYEMIDLMRVGHADHTRMFVTARHQFCHPVYRVRIKKDEEHKG